MFLIVLAFLEGPGGQGGLFKLNKNGKFLVFLAIGVFFPKSFGTSQVISCPIVFILLCDPCRHGRVLKLMKNSQF